MLALPAALVWLLPGIVAHSPLLGWIIRRSTAELNGTISVRSASLGWLSPVVVSGVEVKDADGKRVLFIPSLSSEHSLSAMIRDRQNLGRIYVHRPMLSLSLRDPGSNVEDVLANYLAPKEEPPEEETAGGIGFELQIEDAEATISDQGGDGSWTVKKMSLDITGDPSGGITAEFSAEIPELRKTGKLAGEARIEAGGGEARLSTAGVPLEMFRAAAARFIPDTYLAGRLSASMKASWGNQPDGGNHLHADLVLDDFSLNTPALKSDRLALRRGHAVCTISWTPEAVEIENTKLDCDVGSFYAVGTLPLNKDGGIDLDLLVRRRQQLDCRLDLARLAQMLPETLRIREGLRIDSGRVRLAAECRPERRGMVWHGELHAADLAAQSGGRRIAWQQPILAVLDAHEGPRGAAIDSLRCESDFLKLHAAGEADQLAASISFSLRRLAEQLGQFVDLGDLQLAGEGSGSLNWKRTPKEQFHADAGLQVNDFQLTAAERKPWRERSVAVSLSAEGRTGPGKNTRLDAAELTVETATDRLSAALTGTVADLSDGGSWPVRLGASGELGNWPARLAPWLGTDDWRLDGRYDLQIEATVSGGAVELRLLKLESEPLLAASKTFNADEPRLRASAAGSWDRGERRLRIDRANFDCATIAGGATDLLVALPESGNVEMAGAIRFQAFLHRLKQWFSDPAKPSSWGLAGKLKGTARFRHSRGVVRGSTEAEVIDLAVADSSGRKVREPLVKLSAAGDYDGRSKVLQLGKFELTSRALAVGAAGHVKPVEGGNEAQIDGQIRYDLAWLARLLGPYLGPGVHVVGRGQSPIRYRGPLTPADGSAAAGIKWDRANIYGFQVGPGALNAKMADGQVRIEPLDLAVSRGRMHVDPRVRLTPSPIELTLSAGPLVERVQIDPAMCASMLKYIAPVLADVTSAQGSFSIVLDGCRVPLADPKKSDLAGRLVIHSVRIGPGPLVRELAVLLGRSAPARLRRESAVAFQMKNGRVYHDNLELIFPDLTIRTHGSVGLDQTLDLVAEMPVPPKWLAAGTLASKALADQVIRIPLKGTLSKPRLDRREMERLNRQFIKKAAGNLLEDELKKQLDRLLDPRR